MEHQKVQHEIEQGRVTVGIEIGSTRIKTVAILQDATPIAQGAFEWENQFKDGFWTYDLSEMWDGLRDSYARMTTNLSETYGVPLTRIASLGISAMMHGYLVFDAHHQLLTPFRTWRNNHANAAARELREAFQVNIPERWSIALLYQAIREREAHVKDIAVMTTLSGYVHWCLTGARVLGIGDASGMFPIDTETQTYREDLCETFNGLLDEYGFAQRIESLLPEVRVAGDKAGVLTEDGARRIDPTGQLMSGCPMCPPEGDAGTGMVATQSVAPRTGNVSVGTSLFAMLVLEHPLRQVYPEIDIVTTPDGHDVAMVHANNGAAEING